MLKKFCTDLTALNRHPSIEICCTYNSLHGHTELISTEERDEGLFIVVA